MFFRHVPGRAYFHVSHWIIFPVEYSYDVSKINLDFKVRNFRVQFGSLVKISPPPPCVCFSFQIASGPEKSRLNDTRMEIFRKFNDKKREYAETRSHA